MSGTRNGRNGYCHKSGVTDTGRIGRGPRDRQGSFGPQLIPTTSVASRVERVVVHEGGQTIVGAIA
jgi:transposase-like protein